MQEYVAITGGTLTLPCGTLLREYHKAHAHLKHFHSRENPRCWQWKKVTNFLAGRMARKGQSSQRSLATSSLRWPRLGQVAAPQAQRAAAGKRVGHRRACSFGGPPVLIALRGWRACRSSEVADRRGLASRDCADLWDYADLWDADRSPCGAAANLWQTTAKKGCPHRFLKDRPAAGREVLPLLRLRPLLLPKAAANRRQRLPAPGAGNKSAPGNKSTHSCRMPRPKSKNSRRKCFSSTARACLGARFKTATRRKRFGTRRTLSSLGNLPSVTVPCTS